MSRRRVQQSESVREVAPETHLPTGMIYSRLRQSEANLRAGERPFVAEDALYDKWCQMRRRVRDTRDREGQRMVLAPEWSEYPAFREWAQNHGYRKGLWFVRTDPKQGWTPDNCQFVACRGAASASRRKPKSCGARPRWMVTAFGEEKGPTAWSRDPRCEVTLAALIRRLRGGWLPEDAITRPPANSGSLDHVLHPVRAFGQTKGLAAWAKDHLCKVSLTGLQARLKLGIAPEVAIRTPPWERIVRKRK